ncbi:hypothetical protein IHE44_0009925 [Lamprotornis superbus]|uniref:Uncharacterized protein n=1 Tax=Lamprotornis superbus TaxID=245042 RepID=A0A835TTA5_9PASS|nr:hypothetical protein IHE44_0009925 [Lamprotornis superbus]
MGTPTLVTWGGVAGVGVIWATDWKLVLQYVPYIGGNGASQNTRRMKYSLEYVFQIAGNNRNGRPRYFLPVSPEEKT